MRKQKVTLMFVVTELPCLFEKKGWKTTSATTGSICLLSQLVLLKVNLLVAVHENWIFLFICFVSKHNDKVSIPLSFRFFPRTPTDPPVWRWPRGYLVTSRRLKRRLAENCKRTTFLRFLIWTLCFSVQTSQKEIPNKRVFFWVFFFLCIIFDFEHQNFWRVSRWCLCLPCWTWIILTLVGLWFLAFLSVLLTHLDE